MSTDYAEMERDFVASLKEDTGRDLAGWMAAINACGHSERNAIIDWLRHQGFQFSWASWLQLIHHNGGRLIYAEDTGQILPATRLRPPDVTEKSSRATAQQASMHEPVPVRAPQSAPRPASPMVAATSSDNIQPLIAGAKGLKPLADLILQEVARAVPGVEFRAKGSLIVMGTPAPFAALLPSHKALRLYANFGPAGVHRAKPADAMHRTASTFPEMLLIDDARSIDEDFLRLIRSAAKL